MSRIKVLATVGLMVLCLAAPAAHAGSVVTFATTNDTNSDDIVWTDNGTSATLNTANTSQGNLVTFQYEHITGLSSALSGPLTAYELINGGAGVTTTAVATQAGNLDIQAINSTFTISYTLATPIVIGGKSLSNLLTATIVPVTTSPSLTGEDGDVSATYSASSSTKYMVTFTSSFLSFSGGSTYSISLAFNSITPEFTIDGLGNFINSFTADLVGSFAANPVPTAIPEVPSAALLIVGMAAVGFAARRRAAAQA